MVVDSSDEDYDGDDSDDEEPEVDEHPKHEIRYDIFPGWDDIVCTDYQYLCHFVTLFTIFFGIQLFDESIPLSKIHYIIDKVVQCANQSVVSCVLKKL